MWYSLINTSLPWMDQMGGLNTGSVPTVALKFEYAISKVEEGSCIGQPSLMMVVYDHFELKTVWRSTHKVIMRF